MNVTDAHNMVEACLAGMQVYKLAARQTGRTERLLASLGRGDAVIVGSEAEARRMRARLGKRSGLIAVVVLDPTVGYPATAAHGWKTKGQAVFDHTWVEAFFIEQIRLLKSGVAMMEERLSRREE